MPQSTAVRTLSSVETESVAGMEPHNGREARNLAEKHRRDKLNASIQELAKMVPHVADSTRRLDKTAVLRFAAHGLRLQYVFGKSTGRTPSHAQNRMQPQLTDTLLQLLDSFFITLTCHGQIVLISNSVEQLLGHCQSDLYGQNILQITHPDDHDLMRQQLIPCDMESLFRSENSTNCQSQNINDSEDAINSDDEDTDQCGLYNRQTRQHVEEVDERLRGDRRCFVVRLAKAGTRSEALRSYEIVKIDGCFRRSDSSTSGASFPIVSQLIRRSRSNSSLGLGPANLIPHDVITQAALHGISGNDIVLVAMARVLRQPDIITRLVNANQLEYRTRHLIDGRIIDCDHRIGLVAGYMKDEVRNLSPFSFMHQDDVRWVIVALRQMYDCNSDHGESYYRLLSRNGHFIYLQTRGSLEIDPSTNKVHSFVCVNTLLDEEEGRRKVQEMKNKFSIIIKTNIPSNTLQDVPASQNPQQLERIVLYLIANLQNRHDNTGSQAERTEDEVADDGRHVKSPSLALIPPEPASVKNSIEKSVSVVNITAAKNLKYGQRSPSSRQGSEFSLSPASSVDHAEEFTECNAPSTSPTFKCSSSNPQANKPKTLSRSITAPENTAVHVHCQTDSTLVASPTAPLRAKQASKQPITVLKRIHTPTVPVVEETTPAKRPSAICFQKSAVSGIRTVISTSLQDLNDSLITIEKDARLLNQQRSHLPSSISQTVNQKLGAIIVEHQKQREVLVNIRSEYDVHIQQKQE